MSNPRLRFPLEQLSAMGGTIEGELFENINASLPRAIYWTVQVQFAPVTYGPDDYRFDCSIICNWICWKIRDWRELDGKTLELPGAGQFLESSFHSYKPDEASVIALALRRIDENLFNVRLRAIVDYSAFFGGDGWNNMEVNADCSIPFDGIAVVPENLDLDPTDDAAVKRSLEPYIDVSKLEPPIKTNEWPFYFRPKVS